MTELLRLYEPELLMKDGYPHSWPSIKMLVRDQAGNRCVRCGHPYTSGQHGNGEWSPCDEQCHHDGPTRESQTEIVVDGRSEGFAPVEIEARWRILTVHHLDGVKANCLWWNLAALCQRCHLTIQGRVRIAQVYPFEHSEWFKPYAAGYYAFSYLGEDLTRDQTMGRLGEFLALEQAVL